MTERRSLRPRDSTSDDARRPGRGDLYSVAELATPAHLQVDRSVAGLLLARVPWPLRPRSAVRARSSDSDRTGRRWELRA